MPSKKQTNRGRTSSARSKRVKLAAPKSLRKTAKVGGRSALSGRSASPVAGLANKALRTKATTRALDQIAASSKLSAGSVAARAVSAASRALTKPIRLANSISAARRAPSPAGTRTYQERIAEAEELFALGVIDRDDLDDVTRALQVAADQEARGDQPYDYRTGQRLSQVPH
jgi:hypothetical protein